MGERASVRSKTTSTIHLSTLPCLILLTVNLRTNRARPVWDEQRTSTRKRGADESLDC